MSKPLIFLVCIFSAIFILSPQAGAQAQGNDSFFLSRKKGLLGKLGKSISTDGIPRSPEKSVNTFKRFNGKIIRSIQISSIGLDKNESGDTSHTFISKVANTFHRTTSEHVIKNNLFFREGEKLSPLLVADNQRFLREQVFLRDAWIVVKNSTGTTDSVDVMVITKDVFSIGGSVNISSSERAKVEVRDENIGGTGNKLTISTIYDKLRTPKFGIGAELVKRNIRGSFLNWTTGFKSFNSAFNSGRYEERKYYTSIEKPFVSRYTDWTGELALSYNHTFNAYLPDSLYLADFKYNFINGDIWGGYNFGFRSGRATDAENRYRHLVAVRTFYNHFYSNPQKYDTLYNAGYADINGFLLAYNIFKQNFYRSNFIYGFGRNEDVPEGTTASVVGGLTNKEGVRRAYYGFEGSISRFQRNRSFNAYTFMVGGFTNKGKIQDVNIIAGLDHFSKLNRVSRYWLNRNFAAIYLSRQVNPFLNEPLIFASKYGLPYFRNYVSQGDTRGTLKLESVFYNLTSYLGFRFAPFIFGDISLLKPTDEKFSKSIAYSAIGGGLRTRNENLVFGTIELRGYYFPRTFDGMKNWKIDLNTKVKFKYNSSFIRRPDFVVSN
jgi:hypothetical protein